MKKIFLIFVFMIFQVAFANLSSAENMIPVTVKVDFGPAAKPAVEKQIMIEDKGTPKEATAAAFPVKEGATCCDPKEVSTIDGVAADPMKNLWWRLKINGTSKNASPHRSRLKANDVVEWIYFKEEQ